MKRWTLLVFALFLVPSAAAQINGPQPYDADYGFTDPATAELTTVLSGKLVAETAGSTGPYGFFDMVGFRVDGLDRVCHGNQCFTGDLAIIVEDGGSAGMKFAARTEALYTAEHALGTFLDARGDDLNSLTLNQSLLAPAVDGTLTFGEIRVMPDFSLGGIPTAPELTLSSTSQSTRVVLTDGGVVVRDWTGKSDLFFLFGEPEIPAFDTDFVVLPFKEGSEATFTPANADAARTGLDFERLQTVFQKLGDASASGGTGEPSDVGDSPLEDTLAEVLDAALIRFPSGEDSNATADDFELVLFDAMVVSNSRGELAWEGDAAFQLQGTAVKGAQPLYGVWLFQLPWWGWLLWAAAIGVFVARLVIKPPKEHDRWDQFRWIGWVAGGLMFALVFFLWDLEMRAVWGTSVLTTDTTGTAFWITMGVQLGTMALVLGAVSWPLSIIIKNTLLLSKQGNFMGLGKPASLLLAYLAGATLLLAYIELIMAMVVANLPG